MENIMSSQVLVLNKNYNPIGITNVMDAFTKVFANIAQIITIEDGNYCNHDFNSWAEVSSIKREYNELCEDHDEFIFTPSLVLEVPRIIRILSYEKTPPRKVRLSRRNVYARDNNTCQYCGKRFKTEELNLDHVIPKSRGGKNSWENIVCSCFRCNTKKANRLPSEAKMKLKRKPVEPRHNPSIKIHIGSPKYSSWKNFISESYWNVELIE